VNKNPGGIWRYKGEFRSEGYFPMDAHPISVMVWGGIGTDGYKTPLLMCPPRVNGETYPAMLDENQIPEMLKERYGDEYMFQQDNAPPHAAARNYLSTRLRLLPSWPAKSPDLNPIEMLWAIVKQKIRGKNFASRDLLFAGVVDVWNSISSEIIIHLTSTFASRLTVCLAHQGDCLNGHWHEVRAIVKETQVLNEDSDDPDE
jgi:hypothetical protein